MLDSRSPLGVVLRNPISSDADDDEQELRAFASGRIGSKPQPTVTFRCDDGSSQSFAYSHLYSITTDTAAGGFAAEFSHHIVAVQGRNLTRLARVRVMVQDYCCSSHAASPPRRESAATR